jgi:hypothetical protein
VRKTLLVGLLTAILTAACGGGDTTTDTGAQPEPATENRIDVVMEEYDFSVEGDAQTGRLLIDFTNAGEQLHHGIIGRLDEGKTLEDVEKFIQKGDQGPPPPWFDDSPIDLTLVSPGERAGVVIDVQEGTYVMLCFMPDPKGKPHVAHGMFQTFDVGPGGDATAVEPDAQISMTEEGAEAPELSAGDSVVQVTNDAKKPGEVFVVELADGKTLDDVEPWFMKGQKGPAPATFYGGTHQFGPGETVTLSFALEPGTYSIVASYGEGKDIKDIPTEFTVGE